MFIDYYKILGIHPGSNQKMIENAYKQKTEQLSPSEEQRQLKEIFELLMDADKRAAYDQKWLMRKESRTNFISSDLKPKINYFEIDKHEVKKGDAVSIKWSTTNSDQVIILPLGPVVKSGEAILEIKDVLDNFFKLELIASNTINGLKDSKIINLKILGYQPIEKEKPALEKPKKEIEEIIELSETELKEATDFEIINKNTENTIGNYLKPAFFFSILLIALIMKAC